MLQRRMSFVPQGKQKMPHKSSENGLTSQRLGPVKIHQVTRIKNKINKFFTFN